jgi:predicted signal transduction protein with EAL and GGDEF domain
MITLTVVQALLISAGMVDASIFRLVQLFVSAVITLYLLRRYPHKNWPIILFLILLITSFWIIQQSRITNGDDPNLIYMVIYPIGFFFFLGERQGWLLTLLMISGLLPILLINNGVFSVLGPMGMPSVFSYICVATLAWITERHRIRMQEKVENSAYIDLLTGVYNRNGFLELLDIEDCKSSQQYLAIFDLDHFHIIDEKGTSTMGDAILN